MQCEFTKEDGTNCDAQAVKDDVLCFVHTNLPTIVGKRDLGRQEGGRNGRKMMLHPASEEIRVKNAQQVVKLLEQTINDVRMNRMAVNQANCIGYLCNIMAKIFEQEMLETRISILERTVLISREKVNE